MTRSLLRAPAGGLALGVTCALSLLLACSSALPEPNSADASRAHESYSDISLEQLAQGRTLYVSRCAGCHELKAPRSLAPDRWRSEVSEMREEHSVALRDAEAEAIVRYLEAMAQRGR